MAFAGCGAAVWPWLPWLDAGNVLLMPASTAFSLVAWQHWQQNILCEFMIFLTSLPWASSGWGSCLGNGRLNGESQHNSTVSNFYSNYLKYKPIILLLFQINDLLFQVYFYLNHFWQEISTIIYCDEKIKFHNIWHYLTFISTNPLLMIWYFNVQKKFNSIIWKSLIW